MNDREKAVMKILDVSEKIKGIKIASPLPDTPIVFLWEMFEQLVGGVCDFVRGDGPTQEEIDKLNRPQT